MFVAGLLLLAAVAVAPGVGGLFRGNNSGLTVTATASPAATASPVLTAGPSEVPAKTPAVPEGSSQPSEGKQAAILLDSYEKALVAGKWQTAFDMLAPASPTHGTGLSAYAAERAPYYESVAGQYTIGAPTQPTDWTTYAPLIEGADLSRAYLIEVDYPALGGNNAGYEQFVVAPDASGTWRIWPVR